jgi:hypothetical protein
MILKIYKISRIIFFTIFSIISIYASQFYEGSILIFSCYCFFLLLTFFYLTNSKSSYFEIFFSSYLFLGFWFKYIFSLIFYNGTIFDSGQIKSSKIDEVLILTILITFVCLISSFINKKFINTDVKKNEKRIKSLCENLYLNNRNIILFFFILCISVVGFFNNKLGIYQRGFIYFSETSIYISNLIKWLLVFGFTTFSCFVIHIEILYYKRINIFTPIIAFFEIFISYTSMLSRSFIINSISIIFPIYQKSLFFKKTHDKKFIFLFIFIIILTLISLYVVNSIRLNKIYSMMDQQISNQKKQLNIESLKDLKINDYNFQIPKSESKLENLQNRPNTTEKMINFILVNRWIGIESLILVHSFEKKSFDLFFKSLSEDKNNFENTFYEKTFNLASEKKSIKINQNYLKGNTLPGIISFLYYSGSIYFVLISLFIIIILCNSFERLIKRTTQGNAIFACFLSNLIATRLIHFGYAPKDTYLFVLSILLSILLMIFLLKFKFSYFSLQK